MYFGNKNSGTTTAYNTKGQTLAYWKQAALNQIIDNLGTVPAADRLTEGDAGYVGFAVDKWGNIHEVYADSSLSGITATYTANPYTIPALNSGVSASTQAKLDSLNKTLTAEKKTLTAAQTALTDAKTALTSAQGAQKTAAGNLTEAQTQQTKFRKFVDATFQTLKTAQNQTQDADAAAKALSAAQDKLDDLQQIADDAAKALNDAQSVLQAAQDADQQAQAAVDDAQQASDAAEQHLDDLQNADAKLELAQADASEANEAVANAQKEYDAAKTANTTAQTALTAAKSALKDARAKVDATKKEAAGKSGKITTSGKHATISTSDTVRASVIATATDAKKTAIDSSKALPQMGNATSQSGIFALAGAAMIALLGLGVSKRRDA
jgi:predicted  nucleic acid-binding Zn-ribbon protein